ncbi:MAG: bifunctional diaminohydroxyphosphoribosylaminopyrimidine deaminase/5-amino-6-(5-phosphoribosylamino)uracil reductase RibD [Gallionella sp.]|nr:bifunctional diaminohydroxyphosphoribosylaminopyrimidine deaminase/5-amino-6-(5-phosphoribosylamino)uracil reductase RibD [Gallionella sp.]
MAEVQDNVWMAHALQLAARGLNTTSPNPRVGCVLVREGRNVGEGWHVRTGEPHAEAHALQAAGESARGATAYVTLEPCSHHGRTPPCADALVSAGVKRVVVAVQDPNPQVAGEGLTRLRTAGVEVECGLMESAARELNVGFFSRMTRGRPWIRSKVGMSLDGRTALANGASKWITGAAAREDVQRWRARSCAVLTGSGTVLADDPALNVRAFPCERQPLRVVLDSTLQMPAWARLLQTPGVMIYSAVTDAGKIAALEQAGAQIRVLANAQGQVDLPQVLADLAGHGINEVLVEAGSTLNGALLQAGLVDELLLYVAPQLLGDGARGIAQLGEMITLDQRIEMSWQDIRQVGDDLRILARVKG